MRALHTIIHRYTKRGHHTAARDNKEEEGGERGLRIQIIRSSRCAGEIAKYDYKLNVGQ